MSMRSLGRLAQVNVLPISAHEVYLSMRDHAKQLLEKLPAS